jgi:hypothetical protein
MTDRTARVRTSAPSALRRLRRRLHLPARRRATRTREADRLWRVRTRVSDEPGALQALTERLEVLGVNILDLQVHPFAEGALDELVVSTTDEVEASDLVEAAIAAGGVDTLVLPTTARALADGQTRALSLAIRVAADPAELPWAVADLLGAEILTTSLRAPSGGDTPPAGAETLLKIPSPWQGAFLFVRPGMPFTPAEQARAHRLAELAEQAYLSTLVRRGVAAPVGHALA